MVYFIYYILFLVITNTETNSLSSYSRTTKIIFLNYYFSDKSSMLSFLESSSFLKRRGNIPKIHPSVTPSVLPWSKMRIFLGINFYEKCVENKIKNSTKLAACLLQLISSWTGVKLGGFKPSLVTNCST